MADDPQHIIHKSRPVDIPESFLRGPPEQPIILSHVPWADSEVPEYNGCYAVMLDNVLSKEECDQMLRLAEQSSLATVQGDADPWQPAMVRLEPGWEILTPDIRESDRIVWHQQDVVNRLWERCLLMPGLREKLQLVEDTGGAAPSEKPLRRWEYRRLNERMSFLKYSPGQYFKPHCDAPYHYDAGGRKFQTHYTVHLYLSDSSAVSSESNLVGGATSFLSFDRTRRLDVNPKAGSVLIFQHAKLIHEGAKVKTGVKYTMRTDILYEWMNEEESR